MHFWKAVGCPLSSVWWFMVRKIYFLPELFFCQLFDITNPIWPPDSPIHYNMSYLLLWKEYRCISGVYSYVFMVRESISALYNEIFCTFVCKIHFCTLFFPKNVSKIHNGTQTCRTGLILSIKLMWQWHNGPCSWHRGFRWIVWLFSCSLRCSFPIPLH